MAETPTKQAPPEDDGPEPRHRRAARFGLGLYQQVVAVFAAFGMAAVIGHWWHIGWRGWLETLVGVWEVTIRPAMEWVFHVLVSVPLSWIGVDFEVPLRVRDYVSVGLILSISIVRDFRIRRRVGAKGFSTDFAKPLYVLFAILAWPLVLIWMLGGWPSKMAEKSSDPRIASIPTRVITVGLFCTVGIVTLGILLIYGVWENPRLEEALAILALMLLPAGGLSVFVVSLMTRNPELREASRSVVTVLSPLIYLVILLAINFLVLPHV